MEFHSLFSSIVAFLNNRKVISTTFTTLNLAMDYPVAKQISASCSPRALDSLFKSGVFSQEQVTHRNQSECYRTNCLCVCLSRTLTYATGLIMHCRFTKLTLSCLGSYRLHITIVLLNPALIRRIKSALQPFNYSLE